MKTYGEERALGTHFIGSWLGPRAGLDDVERKNILILLNSVPLFVHPVSQSLYRLRYLGCKGNEYISIVPCRGVVRDL
jgi:hypothetical protein